jgi:ABC-type uncharacterized transport system substrate-binding protein
MRALAVVLLLLSAAPAAAHPHVWVEASIVVEARDGSAQNLHHAWRFDEMFSDFLITEFDLDGDLVFSVNETRRIQEEAFSLLQEYGYFVDLREAGQRVQITAAEGLQAEIDPERRLVTYRFQTPLPHAIPLSSAKLSLALYDETFYVDIGFAMEDAVTFNGIDGCSVELREDPDIDLMGGLFHPKAVWLQCAVS